MEPLSGKISLVTGASRGIGKAIAIALAKIGSDVVVNYHSNESEAVKVASEIRVQNRRVLTVQGDVSDRNEVKKMMDTIEKEFGIVSILVNNAGIAITKTLDDIAGQDWDKTIATNLTSVFLMAQAVLPNMRKQHWGRIINLSSVAAQIGGVVGPHYAASKAGILGLTRYYASALVKEGITVNTIAPGPVATDMAAKNPKLRPEIVPMGRFGTPEEIAEAAVMLVQNGFITGQTISVNGGRYMN